jgi:hypothetical protein
MSDIAIWKFTVQPWQTQMVMPQGARLLHAHDQRGEVCVWAEVATDAPTVFRKVLVIPTGGLCNGAQYVGTAHLGEFVFHVYDGGETAA